MVPVVGRSKTNLVVGRGRLFFDPFKEGTREGTGEKYLGNTPAFNVNRSVETIKRSRSIGGRKVESDPIIVSESYSASFTTDNISPTNVANWFGSKTDETFLEGSKVELTITAQTGELYSVLDFVGDASYAIDKMSATFSGREITIEENFDISEFKNGRFRLRDDAKSIVNGDVLKVNINTRPIRVSDLTPSTGLITGSLRYLSRNPKGNDVEYYYPMVVLTPSGSFDVKADGFQQLSFEVEVFKKSHSEPYQNIRIIVEMSLNERTILDNLLSFSEFQILEDRFNKVVQKDLVEDRIDPDRYVWLFPRREDIG